MNRLIYEKIYGIKQPTHLWTKEYSMFDKIQELTIELELFNKKKEVELHGMISKWRHVICIRILQEEINSLHFINLFSREKSGNSTKK